MKIFKELKKLGYIHYSATTIEELDDLPLNSAERVSEQALVLRWFREKYNLYCEIKVEDYVKLGEQKYYWIIFGTYKSLEGNPWIRCIKDSNGVMSNTYEEAELACLIKLIEIVKNK
jgi:hypothetical protein